VPQLTILTPSLRLGGAERSLVRLVNLLAEHDWSIHLIVFSPDDNELIQELRADVQAHVLGIRRSSNPILWALVHGLLRRLKPDVVMGWSTYANLVAVVTRWKGDQWRLVLNERNYVPEMFHKTRTGTCSRRLILNAIRTLYRRADIVTANSKQGCRFLQRFIGGGTKYFHIPNMIELSSLAECGDEQPYGLPENTEGPKLLALGRLDRQKGFDIALEAMVRVRAVRPWSLVIVGEGPERIGLKNMAGDLGLRNAVHWLGARANPFGYYRWADIVIVPSRFEGFPNVVLEAMACGRAVICSDCQTGPSELTDEGRYGVLVPPEDPDSLADAILALGDDPTRRSSLGDAAARYVADMYDVSVVEPMILEVLGVASPIT